MSEEEDPNAAICSATGKRCRCGSPSGCDTRRWSSPVDKIPAEIVRALKTARLYLDSAEYHLDHALDIDLYQRAYPGPECREIRRKVTTAKAMIDELL